MATLSDQIAWEKECAERGSEKYYQQQDRLRENGQMEQTDVVSYMFKQRVRELAEAIQARSHRTVGKGVKYSAMLRNATVDGDYHKVAYIAIQSLFHLMMQDKKNNTLLKLCLTIGTRVEADLKCLLFEAEHPNYYGTVIDSFKSQKVTDYVHKHKVLMMKFSEFDMNWTNWGKAKQAHIGATVMQDVLHVFSDVAYLYTERVALRTTTRIQSTAEFDTWAAEFERTRGFLHPQLLPLKIKPIDWDKDNVEAGAYYTHTMSTQFPLIKTKCKSHRAYIKGKIPEQHLKALNKAQATAWQINSKVLKVQQEIYTKDLNIGMPSTVKVTIPDYPEHLKPFHKDDLNEEQLSEMEEWKTKAKAAYQREQERKGRILAFQRAYKLAIELDDWDEMYFAYNCDFRGRIYCSTTGLTPQGNDTAKGLLCFKEEVELGTAGINWLAIHGANTYGEDKLSYRKRIEWIKVHEDSIRQTVQDPINARDFWGAADKPYQFLAFCYEWEECGYGRNPRAKSKIPVGMDGSCNGLQHYSAMLRDAVGAVSVNLINTGRPQDIYQKVADVTTAKLRLEDHPYASKWLDVGITRKCTKRAVMTLPYGSTQQSCRAYVREFLDDNWGKFMLHEDHKRHLAQYLTPFLWEAIGEVVIAARAAMKWLRANVQKGEYMEWITPIGFPVHQYYKKMKMFRIMTQINGGMQLACKDLNGPESITNTSQQRNGIAPNFIHSLDSTHMVMAINAADDIAFALIHDDFGTHAGHAKEFNRAIRESFHALYTDHEPLREWGEQVGADLESMPPKGNYTLDRVLSAAYFFG